MRMRSLISAAVAAAVLLGGSVGARAEEVLRLRVNGDINTMDPIATTNFTIRNAAYLIYDTLFALDANYQVQPQMAEGYTLSDDQLTYTITLRDGLKFHDGAPVTAADAVASLQRWGKVDGLGKILFAKSESLTATDDKTLVLKMREPWGQVLPALGKISSNVPVIMPARLAAQDPSDPVKEPIGSGPYRMVVDQWVPGSIAVYESSPIMCRAPSLPAWRRAARSPISTVSKPTTFPTPPRPSMPWSTARSTGSRMWART